MSQLFKLDINEYSISEMRGLLNLESPCSIENIIQNETQLREKLLTDTSVTAAKKQEILLFLSQVKAKLLNTVKKRPTLLGGNHAIIPRLHTNKARERVDAFIAPDLATSSNGLPNPHLRRNLLCIDSRFRDNYYTTLSTDYTLTLPTKIKNVISMELAAFDFPNTYYQISKSLGNNFFWLGWSAPVVDNSETNVDCSENIVLSLLNWFYITIPDGNYKRTEIELVINEQIAYATGKGLKITIDGGQCNVASCISPPLCIIDSQSAKTIFSISPASHGQQIELRFNGIRNNNTTTNSESSIVPPEIDITRNGGIMSNFGWIMGYRMAEYSSSQSYVSEGCYDAWGTKYTYIVVNDFNKNVNNYIIPSYNSSIGKSNILARISMIAASTDNFSDGLSLNNQINEGSIMKKTHLFWTR